MKILVFSDISESKVAIQLARSISTEVIVEVDRDQWYLSDGLIAVVSDPMAGKLHQMVWRELLPPLVLVHRGCGWTMPPGDRIVHPHESLKELAAFLPRLHRDRGVFGKLTAVAAAAAVPENLRRLLSKPCETPFPVRSVNALVRAVGMDRRRANELWKSAENPLPHLRLLDFVHSLILVHAMLHRGRLRSWPAVTQELGLDIRMLQRACERLLGLPLGSSHESSQRWTALSRTLYLPVLKVCHGRGSIAR